MDLFSKQQPVQQDQETQKILNELIRRINDMDRRVRITEQVSLTQKEMLDNLSNSIIKLRKDLLDRIKEIELARSANAEKMHAMEARLEEVSKKVGKLPSSEEFAELKSSIELNKIQSPEETGSLEDALKAFEDTTASVSEPQKKEGA